MKQQTLKKQYDFEGRGLHTGKFAHLSICPAPEDTGIVFERTDLGARIEAIATNVSRTDRSTTLSCGEASVVTVEHLLSALTGLGVDNALIRMDNEEVPILDGSAACYVSAIAPDGLLAQNAERRYIEFSEEVTVKGASGSWVTISPAPVCSYEVTVDFGSRVLGVQTAGWEPGTDYAAELASCRTFCFFHELEFLASHGLIKGGDVDNAVVVVEHPVTDEQIDRMCEIFGQPRLSVSPEGYLSNVELRFPNECGRHKLLDLMGDMRLLGGFPRARITAFRPGHAINSAAARAALQKKIENE